METEALLGPATHRPLAIYYFYGDYGDERPYFNCCPWIRGWLFHNPSECVMLIPGTYEEMNDD